jgi:putative glutamine amidotransferase
VRVLISWNEKSENYERALRGTETVVYDKNTDWQKISGVLFTGGVDIAPSRYGEKRYGKDIEIDESRDATEFEIAEKAFSLHLPVLGICRGCQLINVFLGGSLFQHIEGHSKVNGKDSLHEVEILEKTRLFGIVNEKTLEVNSAHHQAIKSTGKGLRVSARAMDRTIEGIESSEYPFLGVQWHPERLDNEESTKIFSAFVKACSKIA